MKSFFQEKKFSFLELNILAIVVFSFFLTSAQISHATSYQKIAPGDTVTIGEFVFDDDFVATTTPCTVGITDPLNVEIVASTTLMTANNDGWHYYNYTTAGSAPSGVWPTVMICGSVQRGDLVIVDKSFIVDWSLVSTSTIKEVVDESLTVATSSLAAVINANTNTTVLTASSSLLATLPVTIWSFSGRTLTSFGTLVSDVATAVWTSGTRTLSSFGTLVADVWTNTTRTLTGAGLDSGSLATQSDVTSAVTSINNNTNSASSSLAGVIENSQTAINANTNAQLLVASTSLANFINNNSNTTILAASTSLAAYLSAYTEAASSSIVAFVNANTNSTVLAASTSIAEFINANTNSQISGAISLINTNTNTQIITASTSLATSIPINVWNATTRSLTTFGTLVSDVATAVWTSGTRTLSSFGTLVADVWTNTTRTLTGAGLDSGSLATQSDVQTATSSLASAITAGTSEVNSNTNAQLLVASTSLANFINNNSNTTILAASTSLAAYLSAYTEAASSSIVAFVNANTNSTVLAASTSIAEFINANTNSQVSGITNAVNLVTESASTSLAAAINTASSSVVSQILSSISNIPASVWGVATSTLTSAGSIGKQIVDNLDVVVSTIGGGSLTVGDIWSYTTRTLTSAGLDSGSLATQAYVDTATSTLVAEISKGHTVTLSDFGETTVNTAYKAKLQVLNYATIPTDADFLPTVVITDPAGTVQVPAGVMTKDSNGTYSYSYSIGGSAVGGVWETVVSVVINGETAKVNDYWSLSSSPADVQIIEITDKVVPTITANVRIDNMGTSASDFYYIYCVVTNENNLCGGDDDVDFGSDTAYISAGNFINLSLTLDEVPTAGTYWFKVKARALAETNWAASTEQFAAESGIVTPPPSSGSGSSGGGGGGGGGGGIIPAAAIIPTITTTPSTSTNTSDFNRDNKVNSVDFSILLAFWQKQPPFKNPYVDINKDGKVNSVDFSILLYQWKK